MVIGDWMLTAHAIAQEAMGKYTIEKDIAQHIKRTVGRCPYLLRELLLTTQVVR
jgi:hypothetical protein